MAKAGDRVGVGVPLGFEWFVAWRHLRDPERRSRRTLVVGLALLTLGLAAYLVSYLLARKYAAPVEFLRPHLPAYYEYLRQGAIGGIILGLIVSYLGLLFASFTVFTAISIFGVFLGTAAPILVLSVMSGFEADLKGKIRGAKADVVITRADDLPFVEWQQVRAKIKAVPGVLASTPYLESEVMLNASGTPAGVILRGIDPDSAPGVLDLERTLREGKVADLAHPERVQPALPTRRNPLFEDGDARDSGDRDAEEGDPGLAGAAGAARPTVPGKAEAPRPMIRAPGRPARLRQATRLVDPLPPPPDVAAVVADVPPLPTVLLGEELYSRNLRVFVGSDIMVVCPLCVLGPTGMRPRSRPFRVAGHFYSGMYEFDSKLAYVSLQAAQRFLGLEDEVTGIDIRTQDPERAGQVAEAIAATLAQAFGAGPGGKNRYEVRSWEELNKGLFMALRLEKIAMFIVLTFIALVASFSIISNLIMMVTEKGREVAILKAMGANNGAILRVFFAEGLYIGLLGLGVGVAAGVLSCALIEKFGLPLPTDVYYISKLPVVMRAGEIVTVAALALVLCCLATLYPAVMASRMRPVEGLRYE